MEKISTKKATKVFSVPTPIININSSKKESVSRKDSVSTLDLIKSIEDEPSKEFSPPLDNETNIVGLHLTHTKHHESVLLKNSKKNPSKIIHIPSKSNPDKQRGYLVPKDYNLPENVKRKDLPKETIPLECNHGSRPHKNSCTVHGLSEECHCN